MLIFRICSVLIKRVYGCTNRYRFTNMFFRTRFVSIKRVYGCTNKYEFTNSSIFRTRSVSIKRVYGYTNRYRFTNMFFRICSVSIKRVYGYTDFYGFTNTPLTDSPILRSKQRATDFLLPVRRGGMIMIFLLRVKKSQLLTTNDQRLTTIGPSPSNLPIAIPKF